MERWRNVCSYGSPQLFSALFNFMHNGSVLAGAALIFFIYLFCVSEKSWHLQNPEKRWVCWKRVSACDLEQLWLEEESKGMEMTDVIRCVQNVRVTRVNTTVTLWCRNKTANHLSSRRSQLDSFWTQEQTAWICSASYQKINMDISSCCCDVVLQHKEWPTRMEQWRKDVTKALQGCVCSGLLCKNTMWTQHNSGKNANWFGTNDLLWNKAKRSSCETHARQSVPCPDHVWPPKSS